MVLLLQLNLSKYKLDGFLEKGFFEIFHEIDLGDGVNTENKYFYSMKILNIKKI